MRILVIPMNGGVGLGPLTRCLAVAEEAVRRNHEVAFLCKRSFADVVTRYGYKVYKAPLCKPTGAKYVPFRLSDVAVTLGLTEASYIEKSIRAERRTIKLFGPDVIFTETQITVPISAAVENVPWAASTSWADHPDFRSPLYPDHQDLKAYEDRFNRVLKRYKLPEITDISELAYLRADCKIAPTVPELQPELRRVPGVQYVGYLLSPDMEEGELPDVLQQWDGNNPTIYVYMSPGDIPPERWIPAIIAAFQDTEFNVMVSLAPLNISLDFLPTVPNVLFFNDLPGSTAVSRSDLVITHGGGNTVTNAFLRGRPMMIFPHLYAERDYNGRAVERVGAGMNVRTKYFNSKDIVRNARRIITDGKFASNSRKIGVKMRRLGGSTRTLDLLEMLRG